MYVQRSPVASVTPLPVPPIKAVVAQPNTGFAEVIDLAAERERRSSEPPQEVLDAVDEAARVYELLDAAGMQVRFDLSATGVSAELRDRSGAVVRPLSLHEVMNPSSLLPPDAAA
jgi:hypothetical protein